VFDFLEKHKDAIEQSFGETLTWDPLIGKKSCRIYFKIDIDGYEQQNWKKIIEWFSKYVPKFEKAFKKPLQEVKEQLKEHVSTSISED
jgi:hypothetical protein